MVFMASRHCFLSGKGGWHGAYCSAVACKYRNAKQGNAGKAVATLEKQWQRWKSRATVEKQC
jgi:hypothetical protein